MSTSLMEYVSTQSNLYLLAAACAACNSAVGLADTDVDAESDDDLLWSLVSESEEEVEMLAQLLDAYESSPPDQRTKSVKLSVFF